MSNLKDRMQYIVSCLLEHYIGGRCKPDSMWFHVEVILQVAYWWGCNHYIMAWYVLTSKYVIATWYELPSFCLKLVGYITKLLTQTRKI